MSQDLHPFAAFAVEHGREPTEEEQLQIIAAIINRKRSERASWRMQQANEASEEAQWIE